MNTEGIIIRPPSEAESLILQVSIGCSHNKCTFCPAYKKKRFRIKPVDEIYADIDQIANYGADDVRRVFLCDGDPLIIPSETLIWILNHLGEKFPRLQRVGIYGNAKSILEKSSNDLLQLKQRRLGIIYMGLESGDRETLERVKKGVQPEQMIDATLKIKSAGIKLNVTTLLGLGGRDRSRVHAYETMRVLNQMKPNHVGALTLMIVPGTELYDLFKQGKFAMPDKFQLIEELRTMIGASELENCLFFSNHASNYFPIKARLSRDKERILSELDYVISSRDEKFLRSEHMRAL